MRSSDISNKAPDHSKASTIDTPSTPSTPSIPSTPSTPSKPSIPSIPSTPSTPVLIITYYWPPSGGAGVQRWLKFSKYLPETGWEPVILTVDTEYAVYPFIDSSLNEDVPANLKVYRTKALNWFRIYAKDKSRIPSAGFARNDDKTLKGRISRFIRGNFFIPDPRRGWNRYAFKKASAIIKDLEIKHIITTGPPHSTHLIGRILRKKHPEIRWISDLRDPWTEIFYYEQFYPTFISRSIDRCFEKSVLKGSDALITVSNSFRDSFCTLEKTAGSKFSVIANGYDPQDLEGLASIIPERLTISYTGTFSEAYPVNGLIAALKKLTEKNTDLVVRFAGDVPGKIKHFITQQLPVQTVEFHPYMIHRQALQFMLNSTILVLLIPENQGNRGIIPGKLFEYLAAKKAILCLGPEDSDSAAIIDKLRAGKTKTYDDVGGIMEFIEDVSSGKFRVGEENPVEYSRQYLARRIADVLNDLD